MRVLTTAPAGSPEWLAARKGKIGGTAAAAIICGADRNMRTFGTPLSIYMAMTGQVDDDALAGADDELRAILRWGTASEALHRDLLADETKGIFDGPPGVLQHDSIPWLAVSPDGRATFSALAYEGRTISGRGSLELKAPTRFTTHEWEAGSPLPYQVQASAVMAVEGTPFCLVSALIPPRPQWGIVVRDPTFEQFMLDELGHFMDFHVAKGIPPPASFRPIDKALLYRLHPKDNGLAVELAAEFELEFAALRDESEALGALEKAVAGRKARIQQAIGPNSIGRAGPFQATFKHQTRTVSCKSCGVVTSHAEFRVFRPNF